MSTITAPTRMLVGMLQDLLRTAYPHAELPTIHGVHLHTGHGDFEMDLGSGTEDDFSEPPLIEAVPTDLLIGTSTDQRAVAQAHLPCDGHWTRSAFVATPDAKAVVAAFGPLVSSLGKEVTHITELELTGDVLTVREWPSLVPDPLALSFNVGTGQGFPSVMEHLVQGPGVGVAPEEEATYGHGWSPSHLTALGAVGTRRKAPIAVYRWHHKRPAVVTIGASYRAAFAPAILDMDGGALNAPQVSVYQLEKEAVGG